MGRVLIAAVDFTAGELVLEEAPLLTWQEDPMALFRDFMAAPEWKQTLILDMARSKVSPERAAEHEEVAAMAQQLSMAKSTARAVLVAVDTNAHQIRAAGSDEEHAALFARASKAEHSCNPNCAKTVQALPGKIRYSAIRSIKAGERISICYLPDLWSTPRECRRSALLEQEKGFICSCSRCTVADDCRGLACPSSKCKGKFLR
eukprot:TRINITY_DN108062_c0_g1_i1.p1 TRINITY_DN108062_c0_g1~~TRINITY_DN108062_c0_g1_i1.p1  ORF type:complete len:229 (-),score=49.22 TRINITY_DN108062_c0_g1_i1:2-613(-)